MTAPRGLEISGYVHVDFASVKDAFARNFTEYNELGGACCVYLHGEKVVDLWGGLRDRASDAAWEADTLAIIHSATKGLAAMVMAFGHSQGWFDYDARVFTYWPEFAQNGKEHITVRQLLAHQAGLFAFDEPVDKAVVGDLDRLAEIMARQTPAWPPGERQAYHAISLGFYEGELIRRTDPDHRTLGQVFEQEIRAPLGIEAYIDVPETLPASRIAPLEPPGGLRRLVGFSPAITLAAFNRRSVLYRSLIANPGTSFYLDPVRVIARKLEVPSGGGVATARALAVAYGAFASGGDALGLRRETLEALQAPARPATHGFFDECLHGSVEFSLGFMKPSDGFPFGHRGAFGSPGAGGAMGYADPQTGIGYGYVTSRMGMHLNGDPRDVALRQALASVVG